MLPVLLGGTIMSEKTRTTDIALSKLSTKLNRISPSVKNELLLSSLILEYSGICYPYEEECKNEDIEIIENQINELIKNLSPKEEKTLSPLINTFKMVQFMCVTKNKASNVLLESN